MNLADINPGMPLNAVHPEYGQLTADEQRERGFAKLQQYVSQGRMRAAHVVDAILHQVPRDRYVRAQALRFGATEDSLHALRMIIGGQPSDIHRHALDQVADRVRLNQRYMHQLLSEGAPWANQLVALNLNELLTHQPPEARYLLRDVDGTVRGVLTEAYKRIDSRPTVDALIHAAGEAKAAIVDGIYTETRVSLKVVRVEPVEVFPGEWMVFGLDYSNSDYGDGASEFSAFLLRLLCLNGAVTIKELRRVHIGRRFSGDDAASERTLRLDAAAQASLARDQVRALLSDPATENLVRQIRHANSSAVEPDHVEGFLRSRTNKTEEQAIVDKFISADVVELPPGQTAWRMSNAISWLARQTEDGRRRMELERIAGEAMA
jgi:hypothetical protein